MHQNLFYTSLALCAAFLLVSFPGPTDAGFLDFESDCGNNASHHYFYGKRERFDQLMYAEHVLKSSSFMRKVVVDLDFPVKGQVPPQISKITYMEAIDQKTDGTGACVYIRDGGIGSGRVTLHIKSQRGKEINHVVKIYGFY